MFKEELFGMVSTWSIEQLNLYIEQLEKRIDDTKILLKELRSIRKRKTRKIYDNGTRGGLG